MEYRKTLREMRLYGMLTLPKTHYNATKVTMTHLKNMGEGVWSVVVSDAKYFTIQRFKGGESNGKQESETDNNRGKGLPDEVGGDGLHEPAVGDNV